MGSFMGTDIHVIDDGSALGAARAGDPCPKAIGVRHAGVSRRLRRLGATVIDIPSLSANHFPSAYLGNRPDLLPACTTRPDRRRSHLHVRSPRAVVGEPDAAEAATMLSGRDRTAATVSYDLSITAAAKGSLSPAHLTWIETMIGCSDIITLSEDELASLRPGERHADAVRWVMARGPAIIAVTDGVAGVVGYVRGGSVLVRHRRAADVVATHAVSGALTAGLLFALDERGLLGASAYEALRGIGIRELHDVFRDANRYGASTSSPLPSALPRPEIVLGA
jgi:sugar/nucleoside kinase (ribokinase family)